MDDLEEARKLFSSEVATLTNSFYVWKSINNIASKNTDIHQAINDNALSWRVITHSLQVTFFIAMGRLFDGQAGAFTADILLKCCLKNIDQFSYEEVRKRKIESVGGDEPEWLEEYMKGVYQPTKDDFQSLRGEVSKYRKIYLDTYRPIRNKLMAHKDIDARDDILKLFEKTNIGELEGMIQTLDKVENIVFDLLFNGELKQLDDYNFKEDERVNADVEALLNRLA